MKHTKKILILVLSLLFLFSCSFWGEEEKTEEPKSEVIKKDFYIQTKKITEFWSGYTLKKTWKLSSSENINVSSNAVWRVTTLNVKKWDKVSAGQVLAKLEDNVWSYGINLSKAQNALESAKIQKQSNIINLDKQISDLGINIKTLENNLIALKQDKEQTLKKSKDDLENLNKETLDSKSSLEIQKLEDSIKKLEFDYETKLASDEETIKWFKISMKKEHSSIIFLMDDVIKFSDELLWVTKENKDKDDKFSDFLWAKDRWQKQETKNKLLELIAYREEMNSYNIETQDDIDLYVGDLSEWYDKIKELLESIQKTLNNSIESVGSLSSTQIDTYTSSVNLYQNTMQWGLTGLIAFKNSVNSFLRTYKSTQESMLKQIAILKSDKEIFIKSLDSGELWAEVSIEKLIISYDDRIKSMESQIELAKSNLENAKKTKDVTIRSLDNSISSANISVSQAQKEYSKLTIKSPISWIIKEINVDLWQEVSNWTPVFSVLNNKSPEVIISLDKQEHNIVKQWDKAYIKTWERSFTWRIADISNIADDNLNFSSTVSFDDSLNSLWELVDITIPLTVNKMFIPVNLVTVSENNIWIIKTLKDWKIEAVKIELWNLYWEKIELIKCVELEEEQCKQLDIISVDVTNFDEEKFELVVE